MYAVAFIRQSWSLSLVSDLKYLGRTVTNQNCILQGIRSRLHLGNSCHHAVRIVLFCLSFCYIYFQIGIHRSDYSSYFVLVWRSVSHLRKGHKLGVFDIRTLGTTFGPKGERQEDEEKSITYIILYRAYLEGVAKL
jgi:hypothetical protein